MSVHGVEGGTRAAGEEPRAHRSLSPELQDAGGTGRSLDCS